MAAPSNFLGLAPADIGTAFAGMAAMATMVALWTATTVRDPMRGRVRALQARREQLKAGLVAPRRRQGVVRKDTTEMMRQVLARLSVLQTSQMEVAQTRLAQAGIRSRDAVIALIFARMVAPIVIGGGMVLAVYVLHLFDSHGPLVRAMLAGGALFGSYKGPDIFVKNRVTKRTDAIRKGLPDALDLLVICAEAGLTVDAAFGRVARELFVSYPELADELTLTSIELGFLPERRIAFENFSHRVDLESIRGVVTTLIQTEKYGTPLASSLRVLSAEFRNDRMMRAEAKAARLPAIMTVPLICFILPVLFVVIMGPAACSIADGFGSTMK